MIVVGPALLFCPADRFDRCAKAAERADSVIIDLEDAVAPADKAAARANLSNLQLDSRTTIVRVNPVGTADHDADLVTLSTTPYTTVMLAKAESVAQVDALSDFRVIALCETAVGVERAEELARHPAVVGLMWGAEDLIASLGGRSSRFADGSYRDVARHARARVLLAARAAGKAAIDAVYVDIADTTGLRAEVDDAAASGFTATACIHPSQVEIIRAGYAPTPDEVQWAREVLDLAKQESGVFRFRGQMVDEPILRQARQMLSASRG